MKITETCVSNTKAVYTIHCSLSFGLILLLASGIYVAGTIDIGV
jgi:hypothetical protein